MTDIVLREGQKLTEHWEVEFTGMNRVRRPAEEWVSCRIVNMYHNTIYGGSTGRGKTVDEARLSAVVATARAICDDVSAFEHDADEIFKGEQYRWFLGKIQEYQDEFDSLDEEEDGKRRGKLLRRIKQAERLMAEWQEEHDYWPEPETQAEAADEEARLTKLKADIARRRAASASISALAAGAAARTNPS